MFSRSQLEVFLTDIHWPHHDPEVWDLELQVIRAEKPNIVWLNGDNMDFPQVSKYAVRPRDKFNISDDIKVARKCLQRLRDVAPNATIKIKEGNHDSRLQKYLWNKAEELSEMEELEIPKLLKLDTINAEWVPNFEKSKIGHLYHLHGNEIGAYGVNPARQALQRTESNCILGHAHRFSVAHSRNLDGEVHGCYSIGCTSSINVDYAFHAQWDQGFAIVEYNKSGLFHVNPIEVFMVEGRKCCIVNRTTYWANT